MNDPTQALKSKIDNAPNTPGCYFFYDRAGHIIYIGKSKSLRSRVRSYFGAAAEKDERIAGLIREIADVSFEQTETELDALMLEYRLIKRHKPWFNAQHIRDVRPYFLSIRLDTPYPTVEAVQAVSACGHSIGPFKDTFKAEEAMELLSRVWQTPLCGKTVWPRDARPCLYHGMGKCFAPCCADAQKVAYPHTAELSAFLAGRPEAAFSRLEAAMTAAVSGFRFEEAGALKETMARLTYLSHKIEHGFRITESTHAILLMRGFGEEASSAFYIREGTVRNRIRLPAGAKADAATEAFDAALQKGAEECFEHPVTEACLAEISAHRRFVTLPENAEAQFLSSAFSALYRVFAES